MELTKYKIALILLSALSALAYAEPKPIVLNPSYNHDKYQTLPRDIIKEFRAYTISFDSNDDNDGDGIGDSLGIPEWVSYEIKRFDGDCIPTFPRPPWFSDDELVADDVAPTDDSYRYSSAWRHHHPDWYERGHLQMKLIAEELGHDAAHNTHTMLNAVPQRKAFNKGIWLEMEYLTAAWAQEYGDVWVITGPVVLDGRPSGWAGQGSDFRVAIPDALFKIVIKGSESHPDRPDVLAFLYPQIGPSYYGRAPYPHQNYLVSVDTIEEMTGLDFFTSLDDEVEDELEAEKKEWLWPVDDANFIKACTG